MILVGLMVWIVSVQADDRGYVTIPEQDRSSLIIFSHSQHLADYGLQCADCHTEAMSSETARDNILPKKAACAVCHKEEVDDEQQCAKCHRPNAALVPFESPQRLIEFPHDYHLTTVDLECESCHTGMAETDYASRHNWPVMDDCLTCHQDVDAPLECETCHPKVEVIRPRTHGADWVYEHKQHSRAADMPCQKCHDDGWCEDCHAGALLVGTTGPTDRTTTYAPSSRGRVGQVVQRQHEPNYRFLHPLDAASKERQCQTCHEPDYCLDCHRGGGQEGRFKPIWHGPLPEDPEPWVVGGMGAGGGRHASWARRDLERCIACHDVDGADPSCLQCHVDFDGVRGTDPATHGRDFTDVAGNGSFHSDESAGCYACHVNTRSEGVGFCGYCHL